MPNNMTVTLITPNILIHTIKIVQDYLGEETSPSFR